LRLVALSVATRMIASAPLTSFTSGADFTYRVRRCRFGAVPSRHSRSQGDSSARGDGHTARQGIDGVSGTVQGENWAAHGAQGRSVAKAPATLNARSTSGGVSRSMTAADMGAAHGRTRPPIVSPWAHEMVGLRTPRRDVLVAGQQAARESAPRVPGGRCRDPRG
jgi:hypothetical protein